MTISPECCFHNLLEPEAYVKLFHSHPPIDFFCEVGSDNLPLFFTNFDLLTTMESKVRERLLRIPFLSFLMKRLVFSTCFVGMTTTEYLPLPKHVELTFLLDSIVNQQKSKSLIIIKDLPDSSPLLSEEDNAKSNALSYMAIKKGFIKVEGQALAYVPLNFSDQEEYFSGLSSGRRKDLRRKMKSKQYLDIEVIPLGDLSFNESSFLEDLYAMYIEVYNQSEIHFDLLSPSFFTALLRSKDIQGVVVCYRHKGALVGHNICLIHNDLFIDKYIGFRYPLARKLNLYFISWLENLRIAKDYGCKTYIAGWTDPEVKASLGAKFTFTHHLVWVQNLLLRRTLYPFRYFFESDSHILSEKL